MGRVSGPHVAARCTLEQVAGFPPFIISVNPLEPPPLSVGHFTSIDFIWHCACRTYPPDRFQVSYLPIHQADPQLHCSISLPYLHSYVKLVNFVSILNLPGADRYTR